MKSLAEIGNHGIGIVKKSEYGPGRKVRIGNSGFTMIELVVIIVIIGILSAIAVPKFINLQNQAMRSVRDGLTSNLRSAATLAYAKASINGDTLNLNAASVLQQFVHTGAITLNGNTFSANVNGVSYSWAYSYPATISDPTP
jgi:prepilin-type N-terminal cleavage/methylation domain-containing protein